MTIKIRTLSFIFCLTLIGCSSQIKLSNVYGTYEGKRLMLSKELTLSHDSTYLYSVEGDLYPTPLTQEGYWTIKNKKIKLSAQDCRLLNVCTNDSIKVGTIYFYFFDSHGNPLNDFEGSLQTKYETCKFIRVKDNLYKVSSRDFHGNGYIKDSHNLYNECNIRFRKQSGKTVNVYYLKLFVKNKLQKNTWRFKYKDGILYQKKGSVYKK